MTAIAILLLAAGASRRMQGRDKLMEMVPTPDGPLPLIRARCDVAQATGLATYVTLPAPDHPRAAVLDTSVTPIPVPAAAEGMAASIRAGIREIGTDIDGVMIVPADMPDLTTADLSTMAAAFCAAPDHIHRATSADGTMGHPVVFPSRCFNALLHIQGDAGARSVLRGEEILPHPLPGTHALTDLDTPEAWASWRAAQNQTDAP